MKIAVSSEIKKLKKVLLHRPGRELLNLEPDSLKDNLFDDIPYLKVAQKEHDFFVKKLEENGVEVVLLEDLVAETLEDKKVRELFIRQFINEANAYGYEKELYKYLNGIKNNKELIIKTMEGVNLMDLRKKADSLMVAAPMPNLYFTRDSFACIGNSVSINRMKYPVRQRETIYGEYIFKYHKDYKDTPIVYNRYEKYHIEGGDITNISDKVIAIGISERTEKGAIEILVNNLFKEKDNKIEKVLVLVIPKKRAYMHLDTVFTQVDYDKFVVHPGIIEPLKVYEYEKGKKVVKKEESLEKILEEALHIKDIKLIKCGAGDKIAAEREQWNDGSNTLCIAPGVCIVYERNEITNLELVKHGIKIIEIPSSELSRGRGGPRCMSMPLEREE